MVLEKQEHALRRRIMAPAFSERALRDAESLISIHARNFAEQLGAGPVDAKLSDWTPPKNVGDLATFYGFDFVSDLGYGRAFDMLGKEDNRWISGVLKSASRFLYYVGYLPFIALVRPLMGTSIQDYIGGKEAADSLKYTLLANRYLAERMEHEERLKNSGEQSTRKDTFHYLLNSEDTVTRRKSTVEELQADSALIIAAGSDGVGLAVAATIFYLVRDPAALSKLTKEVRAAFAGLDDIRNPKLSALPYLGACIDETMRMCPPKASTLPREILTGGMMIDGHHIPEGVEVGTAIYVLHHDERIYPSPWHYRPE